MSHPVVEKILSGEVPRTVLVMAAQARLPIPREDQLELWACLRNHEDPDVRMACRESLAAVEPSEWLSFLKEFAFRDEFWDFAVKFLSRREDLAGALLSNRALPDAAFSQLAGALQGGLLDRIIDNQSRLLAKPDTVLALLGNPGLSPTQVRRIFDLAEQFFRNHSRIPAVLEERFGLKIGHAGGAFTGETAIPQPVAPPKAEPAPVPEKSQTALTVTKPGKPAPKSSGAPPPVPGTDSGGEELTEEVPEGEAAPAETLEEEANQTLYQQLLTMKIPEKIALAVKGNKEARLLLIRDSNKIVQEAVIDSPKITEGEVEAFCKMRNLPEELLRKIARNGEWMKLLPIARALATNPKTPVGVALPLVSRLTDFDIKNLLRDKNVSELIRREAKKIYDLRHTPKQVSFKKKG